MLSNDVNLHDYKNNMDPMTWPSLRADKDSAWHGHVSFAHWLVQAVRPKIIVELGSHNGVSYSAFCNAVTKCSLQTKCYAVDTWQGDAHAGHYGEDVYQDLLAFNTEHFGHFSTLVRSYFDDARQSFADHSIDILHIDGLHTYDAVKHDFESWLPKLSPNAIVLFHDTDIRHADFGVWMLWDELIRTYRGFNFLHSAGLGVLAIGENTPPALLEMLLDESVANVEVTRSRFADASTKAHIDGLQFLADMKATAKGNLHGRNIALNRYAMQSSAFQNGKPTPNGAVNGIKNGGFGFHTEMELNPWWMLDLGSMEDIREIVIYNRIDSNCRDRSRRMSVFISPDAEAWHELYFNDGASFGGIDGFPLRITCEQTSARFIRIRLNDFQYLHLDEVEVYN